MTLKEIAEETLMIVKQGYYILPGELLEDAQKNSGKRIDISEGMKQSVDKSLLITPAQGEELLEKYEAKCKAPCISELIKKKTIVANFATVAAIRKLHQEGKDKIGVLNFASAKNPGGGFLNGAMAQEESLATSSTLYRSLVRHEEYYRENRAQKSMMYTNYGIYTPEVMFFRDEKFHLVEEPVKASVLTLPAVNMNQVLIKGESKELAETVMRRRMKLALCIFAEQGAKHLVLGAYGCGVFGNDPCKVAMWWRELLEEGLGDCFDSIFHAVLSRIGGKTIQAFEEALMKR